MPHPAREMPRAKLIRRSCLYTTPVYRVNISARKYAVIPELTGVVELFVGMEGVLERIAVVYRLEVHGLSC